MLPDDDELVSGGHAASPGLASPVLCAYELKVPGVLYAAGFGHI